MAVLYQKYRPQKFGEIVGQKHVVTTLQNAVRAGQVAHAYLFSGSRGVGKTSMARILARAVNCLNPQDGDACLACRNCLEITDLDTTEIDAASYTGVDNVREIVEQSRSQPAAGKRRVYIIDEVHMLSRAAFNALLKTLEEPPSHALFILATTEVAKVPATVLSRVQHFDFQLHTTEDLENQLKFILKQEDRKLSDEILKLISAAAMGGLRDALTLLDQVLVLGSSDIDHVRHSLGLPSREKSKHFLQLVFSGDASGLVRMVDEMNAGASSFHSLCADILEILRQNLQARFTDEKQDLIAPAHVPTNELMHIIRLFLRAYKEQSGSPDASLPVLLAGLEASEKLKSQNTTRTGQERFVAPETIPLDTLQAPIAVSKTVIEVSNAGVEKPVVKSSTAPTALVIDIDAVRLMWPQVCASAGEINGPFGVLLRQARVVGENLGQLELSVRFDFHKRQLEQAKYTQMLLGALEKHHITASGISVAVDATLGSETNDTSLASALQIFGGEVME